MSYLDKLAYAILFSGLIVGAAAIFRLRYNPSSQFAVIAAFSIFYLVWAVVLHSIKKDLDRRVFLEYLAIAAIASLAAILVFVR